MSISPDSNLDLTFLKRALGLDTSEANPNYKPIPREIAEEIILFLVSTSRSASKVLMGRRASDVENALQPPRDFKALGRRAWYHTCAFVSQQSLSRFLDFALQSPMNPRDPANLNPILCFKYIRNLYIGRSCTVADVSKILGHPLLEVNHVALPVDIIAALLHPTSAHAVTRGIHATPMRLLGIQLRLTVLDFAEESWSTLCHAPLETRNRIIELTFLSASVQASSLHLDRFSTLTRLAFHADTRQTETSLRQFMNSLPSSVKTVVLFTRRDAYRAGTRPTLNHQPRNGPRNVPHDPKVSKMLVMASMFEDCRVLTLSRQNEFNPEEMAEDWIEMNKTSDIWEAAEEYTRTEASALLNHLSIETEEHLLKYHSLFCGSATVDLSLPVSLVESISISPDLDSKSSISLQLLSRLTKLKRVRLSPTITALDETARPDAEITVIGKIPSGWPCKRSAGTDSFTRLRLDVGSPKSVNWQCFPSLTQLAVSSSSMSGLFMKAGVRKLCSQVPRLQELVLTVPPAERSSLASMVKLAEKTSSKVRVLVD